MKNLLDKPDCYDCIHCGACSDAGDSGFSCLKEDASKCKNFQSKEDFVKVVRCKDCKYVDSYERHGRRTVYYCLYQTDKLHDVSLDRAFVPVRGADDYCSCGERK